MDTISIENFIKLLKAPIRPIVIDVRSGATYASAAGVIPGAIRRDADAGEGVYEGVFMNKRSTGTWRVKGAQLCITRGSEEESCDELWRSGYRLERRKPGLPRIRDTVVMLPE